MSRHLVRKALQPVVRLAKKWPTVTVALVIWLMFVPVKSLPFESNMLGRLDLWIFDALTFYTAPNQPHPDIVIVGIDEPSMGTLRIMWPFPRSLHGHVVDKLREHGAKVIMFDVVFAEPSADPREDQAFADAVRRHGAVVLASDVVKTENTKQEGDQQVKPLELLRDAGAVAGLATVEGDTDKAIRGTPLPYYFKDGTAVMPMWQVTASKFYPDKKIEIPGSVNHRPYIRYLGAPHTFPYVSYSDVVMVGQPGGMTSAELKEKVNGKIVLIGRDLKAPPELRQQADMFGTPFTTFTTNQSPGVEIHANAIANALMSAPVLGTSSMLNATVMTVLIALTCFLLRNWRPLVSLAIVIALLGLTNLSAVTLMKAGTIWPIRDALMALILIYLTQGAIAYISETLKRREIKDAFSRYVSPELVDQIAANPEALKLGGQRKELSIMFTDLAGFTSIAEALTAEQVERIMNRQFSVLTAIVYKYGGTLDKYIGDAIMAFWNAPLDDPEHATHACKCAIEMQEAMALLRQEFIDEGFPPIHMRVGVHTGICMVGNFGSEIRFNYTVMGDTVNLASRLEGSNKEFHTYILVSDQVAAQTQGVPLCPIGRIRVKGKSEPTAVLTPISEPELFTAMATAYEAYLRRDWDVAEKHFATVKNSADLQGVADKYLASIAHFRAEPPPDTWDGTDTLEVK